MIQIDIKVQALVTIFLTGILSFFTSLEVEIQGLLVFMVIDYISGILVAIIFKNSNKTDTGAYNSAIGFKGLVRKIYIILLLVVLNYVDKVAGTNIFLKLGTVGFMVNELMSIIENAGLMGIKVPKAFQNALDVLKSKEDDEK